MNAISRDTLDSGIPVGLNDSCDDKAGPIAGPWSDRLLTGSTHFSMRGIQSKAATSILHV